MARFDEFLDFDLTFSPGKTQESYRAKVRDSTGRVASEEILIPETARREVLSEGTSEGIESLGGSLFASVFVGDLLGCLRSSLTEARTSGSGLRFRLRFNEAPDLANLAWETLYDPSLDLHFALSNATPIVRYLELPVPVSPLAVEPPLEILVISATPSDYDTLDVETEFRRLEESLEGLKAQGSIRLQHLPKVSLDQLRRKIRSERTHVLHFIGHAGFTETSQQGVLVFEDLHGHGEQVHAKALSVLLRDHESLRLVVINACEGARASTHSPFRGLAPQLVQHGVPAVVAMRSKVQDSTALGLARELYRTLAEHYPIETCLTEARKAIFGQGSMEWCTPVLYLRSADGRLFEPDGGITSAITREPASSEELPTSASASSKPTSTPCTGDPGQIFLSYRRVSSDTTLAKALDGWLRSRGLRVFLDQRIEVGTRWVDAIDREIRASSIFIPILSADSIRSDMVRKEIALAHQLAGAGKLRILPIRSSSLEGQLPYDLAAYLDPIQYALWDPGRDPETICNIIFRAITGADLPERTSSPDDPALISVALGASDTSAPMPAADPRLVVEHTSQGGAVRLSSKFYVEREADRRMERALKRQGTTLVVKGMRQSGKSSLLARTVALARSKGHRTVYLDLQTLDSTQLESCSRLLYTLALRIHSALKTSTKPKEVWDEDIGAKQSFADYLEVAVLEPSSESFLLALDEVDRIFDCPYRADFFGTVRSWHSNRAIREDLWSKLDLAIAHATDPTLWIDDLNQSPFNIGERLRLEGFSPAAVADLNQRYGAPLTSPDEIAELHALVGGQPYLVRQALWVLATNAWRLSDLHQVALDDYGPFGDHLRRHLWVLRDSPRLQRVIRELTDRPGCKSELDFQRLQAAGLLSGETREKARLLCRLYEDYFRSRL